MFEAPTVFVIGAGASVEYNIAAGDKLKHQISELLSFYFDGFERQSGDAQICDTLRRYSQAKTGQYGMSGEHFIASRHISEAMPHALSIDNFVDAHKGNASIELCAKLGIVKSIINEEASSKLSGLRLPHEPFDFTSVSNCWIAKFFQMIHEGVPLAALETIFSNITLIVFNYDRCIEAYLPRAISQYYGVDYHRAWQLVSALQIIHPYGVVGSSASNGGIDPPFGSAETDLLRAGEGINTFSEGLADPSVARAISLAMDSADTIVFLGFSFHPMNLRILENACPNLRRIFGTTYGLSDSAVSNIEEALLEAFEKDRPSMASIVGYDGDCLDEFDLTNLVAYEFCSQYFRSISKT